MGQTALAAAPPIGAQLAIAIGLAPEIGPFVLIVLALIVFILLVLLFSAEEKRLNTACP